MWRREIADLVGGIGAERLQIVWPSSFSSAWLGRERNAPTFGGLLLTFDDFRGVVECELSGGFLFHPQSALLQLLRRGHPYSDHPV